MFVFALAEVRSSRDKFPDVCIIKFSVCAVGRSVVIAMAYSEQLYWGVGRGSGWCQWLQWGSKRLAKCPRHVARSTHDKDFSCLLLAAASGHRIRKVSLLDTTHGLSKQSHYKPLRNSTLATPESLRNAKYLTPFFISSLEDGQALFNIFFFISFFSFYYYCIITQNKNNNV